MELLQLKYFCDAAVSENFTKTAQKFSVPTSDISQTVSRLEKELGVKLFERKANRIHINDNGRKFFEHIKPALDKINGGVQLFDESSSPYECEIRICICVCRRIATKAIEKFKALHPETSLIISHSSEAIDNFDILITDKSLKIPGIQKQLLLSENIVLALNRCHHLAAKNQLTADDLKEARFITMNESSSIYSLTNSICKSMGFIPKIVIQSDDPFYVRRYVEMDLGITLYPEISWNGLFDKSVISKSIGKFSREVYAYSSEDSHTNIAVNSFLEVLCNVFGTK